MSAQHQSPTPNGLYERLIGRLAVALNTADTAVQLHRQAPLDLELSGLSDAELRLINAYLARDTQWLQGWQAAAEEMMLLEGAAPEVGSRRKVVKPFHRFSPAKPRVQFRQRLQLSCALCATPLVVPAGAIRAGQERQACPLCGSQLFRAAVQPS